MPSPNFNLKTASHFMRLTEAQKIKARRRLIGSIIMLLIALIVLLNVTAHVKPIKVTPKTIEIRNTAATVPTPAPIESAAIPNPNKITSSPVVAVTSTHITSNQHKIVSESKVSTYLATTTPAIQKAAPVEIPQQAVALSTPHESAPKTTTELPHFHPLFMSETSPSKSSPADILNDTETHSTVKHYYVQLIVSHDKNKLLQLKHQLAHKGVSTTIQSITSNNKTIYRLRLGPFATKAQATKAYNKILEPAK